MSAETKGVSDLKEKSESLVGARLRMRRLARRLTLQELAEKSGLSVGLLSQIERGMTTPSLRSLRQISTALEMPLGWLFEPAPHPSDDLIVRAENRRKMDLGPGAMVKELMSPDSVLDIQIIRIVIQPGGTSGDKPYNNPIGAKCGTIISGQLGLEVSGKEYVLKAGDSFAFRAENMHRFWCAGDEPVDLIWVVTPALY
ncbi:MAG: XRE family transcriptional regulator [Parvibaculaceae bacterium]|nr:XRE family transcriptional regulator [Parvibaculaceae bacterium]